MFKKSLATEHHVLLNLRTLIDTAFIHNLLMNIIHLREITDYRGQQESQFF